jgi:hypothetical protein
MNIKLLGIDDNSSEYRAGIDLKNFFKENFSQLKGEIFIKPNLTLIGNKVEQLDLVVWGTFENSFETPYRLVINPKDPSNNYKPTFESMNSKVKFKNFFLVIEVKDHPFNRIKTIGYDLFVKYSSKNRYEFDWHNASEQSKNQVHTIRGGVSPFLKKNNIEEKYCPQVTNLIWLRQVSLKDIIPFNIINLLPAEFNSQLFFQTIAKCNPPVGLKYPTIDFIKGGIEASLMAKITNSFFESFEKEIYIKSGELTRRKIEEVIQKQINIEERPYYNYIGKKLIIINGDPGSGKTIHLLQIAYSLYKAQHKRSLILTYNVALASDLNRLSFLSGVQTDQYNPTINIKTIQSFFRDILIAYDLHTPRILENGKLDSDYEINYFLKNYSKLLASLDEIIEADWIDEAEKLKIKRDVIKFNWDIILIDESQDWLEEERNILYKLFGPENFVIAFGDRQFVRQNRGLRWDEYDKNSNELVTVDLFKPIINLSKTYRQKQNLVQFQNQLFSDYSWKLKYNKELIGGEVSIYTNMFAKTDLDAIATEWQSENAAPFDLLMLMPKEYYEYTNKLIDFKDWGYECINGIDKLNSRLNSADVNKIRCFQYESCRGLEGWIVVCHWFDVFLQIKYIGYERDPNDQSLVTDEEAKMKHVSDWAFLATSRAMSHLIITIKDKQSKFGKIIIDSFQKNRDFTILD